MKPFWPRMEILSMPGTVLQEDECEAHGCRRAPEQPPTRSSIRPVGRGLQGEDDELEDVSDAEDDGQRSHVHDLEMPRSAHGLASIARCLARE